jgi:hypothetical protein
LASGDWLPTAAERHGADEQVRRHLFSFDERDGFIGIRGLGDTIAQPPEDATGTVTDELLPSARRIGAGRKAVGRIMTVPR